MFSIARSTCVLFAALFVVGNAFGQSAPDDGKVAAKTNEKKEKKREKPQAVDPKAPVSAEQVAESAILVYGFPGGRQTLSQIRKTAIERGKMSVTSTDGRVDQVAYERRAMRGDTLSKEKIRLDQVFPNARFSLIQNDDKVFGIYDDKVFTPRDDAARAFQNQINYSIEALLRYKESDATLVSAGREKVLGVDYYLIDETDKSGRKMRFYVSAKTYRVMMLEYEDEGVKYKRKFYDYNYAQGTLVPFRSVLYANGKIVEETEIGTVTYGQKIDEGLFSAT